MRGGDGGRLTDQPEISAQQVRVAEELRGRGAGQDRHAKDTHGIARFRPCHAANVRSAVGWYASGAQRCGEAGGSLGGTSVELANIGVSETGNGHFARFLSTSGANRGHAQHTLRPERVRQYVVLDEAVLHAGYPCGLQEAQGVTRGRQLVRFWW